LHNPSLARRLAFAGAADLLGHLLNLQRKSPPPRGFHGKPFAVMIT
jgi:hypothetical protein